MEGSEQRSGKKSKNKKQRARQEQHDQTIEKGILEERQEEIKEMERIEELQAQEFSTETRKQPINEPIKQEVKETIKKPENEAAKQQQRVESIKQPVNEPEVKGKNTCNLHFNINYRTSFGESIWVCGNHEKLGNWDLQKAYKLEWSEGDNWKGTVPIEKGSCETLEYKYICQKGQDFKWEHGANHSLRQEGRTEDQVTKVDNWQT
ncbi:unnamed protein product [Blepharisma stoltei]|uniref:CBM20 domain-containing protein n=1 Tax=Blepharisma stoltei TaxID=1481888 RepID=A0AAU9JXV8_9CILI|nr:unnamed protein product [Blepharisma stoltei]